MNVLSFISFSLLFCTVQPSFASLGNSSSTISNEAKAYSAQYTTAQGSQYQVHILKTRTTTIKEYVSSSDVVFAVTWQGLKKPNLSVLLGSHYQEYITAFVKLGRPRGRRTNIIQSATLYVQGGGHMRDLRGVAYLPSAVPAGVNAGNLQ